MKILIVEDEPQLREVEKLFLENAGYTVIEAEDGEQALKLFDKEQVDLIILDINLPKINGLQLCKTIKAQRQVPVLMVTARTEEFDEVIGLQTGADDYIKKPFSSSILLARVQALLRRFVTKKITVQDLEIDKDTMRVLHNGKEINLTNTQFNLLVFLASHPGRVYSRNDIIDNVLAENRSYDGFDRNIDAHIKKLRKALGDNSAEPKYIATVIGRGYKFLGDKS